MMPIVHQIGHIQIDVAHVGLERRAVKTFVGIFWTNVTYEGIDKASTLENSADVQISEEL